METRHQENPITIQKYDNLKTLGREIFAGVDFSGQMTDVHVARTKQFIREGSNLVAPEVRASYWEHITIAPELGKRLAEELDGKLNLNPQEIETLLWLHDIGRLVTPSAYFRNDLIGDRLLMEIGFPKETVEKMPPLGPIAVLADVLDPTDQQVSFQEPLTQEQEKAIDDFFEGQSPTQRVISLADNLGKRDADGIFSLKSFLGYLETQEGRYSPDSPWASVHWATMRRRGTALAVYHLVEKTASWLASMDIDVDKVLDGLRDYGPKFVLISRHGDLSNPTNIVYNRDSVMGENIIHQSEEGELQMQKIGDLIMARQFKPTRIFTSPETRAQESTRALNTKLKLPIETVDDLDDVFAPDPYRQGWTMDTLKDLGGDVYNLPNTENPKSVIKRMYRAFERVANSLSVGETNIMLSHGDPIAWLANYLYSGIIPNPSDLRGMIYPAKGEALVAVIGPDNKIFTLYSLSVGSGENSSVY